MSALTTNKKWPVIGVAVLLLFAALAITVLSRGQRPQMVPTGSTQPKVTWSQQQIDMFLSPGESASKRVTFVSNLALQNVTIEAVPDIATLVRPQPMGLPYVPANQQQTVDIAFSIPTGTALATYQGTIHLRLGSQTIPQILKITLNVWQSVTNQGLVLRYPPNWQLDSGLLAINGPLSLNTFSNTYQEGGVIPGGEAEIDITTTPVPSSSLNDVIAKDLQQAVIQSTDTILVAGNTGTRVFYDEFFTPGVAYSSLAVYVPRGSLLYKFFLSSNLGDPSNSRFLIDFQEILATARFTQ